MAPSLQSSYEHMFVLILCMRSSKTERKPRARTSVSKEARIEQRNANLDKLAKEVEESYKNRICLYCCRRTGIKVRCDLKRYDFGYGTVEVCTACIEKWESGEWDYPEFNKAFKSVAIGGLPSLGKRS